MPVSTVLLAAIFILCCTGALDRTCRRLKISPGGVAAFAVLLGILSPAELPVGERVTLHPAYLAALAAGVGMCWNRPRLLRSLLLSMACGVCAWGMGSLFPNVYEPGLLYGLLPGALGRFLLRGRRQGLLCALIAPLFFGLMVSLEDWYLFDQVRIGLGSPLQFDMQVCGATLYGALLYLPKPGLKPSRTVEKEG